MQVNHRQDLYRAFVDFIQAESRRERSAVHRRMFHVFFWCFFLPVVAAVTMLLLIKFRVLPGTMKGYLDWLILIFPVSYSLYFLSSEVLRGLPQIFRRGGVSNVLEQVVKEGEWRERIGVHMKRSIIATPEQWRWICRNFEIDLKALQYRTRYLTALAGAVFFLLMQGIDSLTDGAESASWVRHPVFGWIENSSGNLAQFAGLALFLVLLYLSGMQTYHSLLRYLNCADLLRAELEIEAQGRKDS